MENDNTTDEDTVFVSDKFVSALRDHLKRYDIKPFLEKAGVDLQGLIKKIHFIGEVKHNDECIIAIGEMLGISPEDCFETRGIGNDKIAQLRSTIRDNALDVDFSIFDNDFERSYNAAINLKGQSELHTNKFENLNEAYSKDQKLIQSGKKPYLVHKFLRDNKDMLPAYALNNLRIFNQPSVQLLNTESTKLADRELADLGQRINNFLWDIAVLIWDFKKEANRTPDDEISEMREKNLTAVIDCLKSLGYSAETIDACLDIIKPDLERRLSKFSETPDFKYFVCTKRTGKYWVDRENEIIAKIKKLYNRKPDKFSAVRKFNKLSDRRIISNMAIIFAAVDFWPPRSDEDKKTRIKRYIDIIKKRLQKIDKQPKPKTELIDP